ncbi:3-hydroxyacyl-CoA dehydrogenase family protein [Sphingomonas sp.]|uniref:3-hydroxyacyl-CoA dehydrogenase family protein n=1 Tax=Sphingomonas sp. TaxID=28214 RepID=UPI003CC63838
MVRVALIGAGMMGTGLARLFAGVGWPVAVWDRDAAALARLIEAVPAAVAAASLAEAIGDAVLVIEAVAERLPVKQAVFAELAAAARGDAILATNSSVIQVGAVGATLDDAAAARVVGTHFWNPPDLIPLVEVIAAARTADATVERTMALLTRAGREPVRVRRDVVPGNRLQHALWREAMSLVDEGVCSPADVDHIVRRSFGARLAALGPLENADLVGLELTRDIHQVVLPMLSRASEPAAGLLERLAGGRTYLGSTADEAAAARARLAAHLRGAFA